ncbi:uncharacterized protein LACBIDRAFT_335726 [Laccaria bicolor S238N-H82]|uniref:Predicted protein n=1 Tax=Laccaria bicolor (strain S238N-H82 / ATCC MYA-4686) TaxID=486041 RepID=B0E1C0_LACBS|nr:uncharacterized protein LACBIDRAFT_335092 [Laccaria bicolor S238N-H82]XP_001890648.1 uncharacterized protein LACBIDRAFT_335726 [Laccaria bicolor S238N-H82]EDQ98702.1 predicted protein [Laccaria bicolor S238N-H82]EDQ99354.1 predicted protein [Laccaria bicolor S238N-H82]|eukprot:XP_001890000.1 predicted protein [Laccaria bicolor S238N-H82]
MTCQIRGGKLVHLNAVIDYKQDIDVSSRGGSVISALTLKAFLTVQDRDGLVSDPLWVSHRQFQIQCPELRRRAVLLSAERKKLLCAVGATGNIKWNIDFGATTPPVTKYSVGIASDRPYNRCVITYSIFRLQGHNHSRLQIRRRESPLPEGCNDVLQTWVAPWVATFNELFFLEKSLSFAHSAIAESVTFEEGAWRKEARSHKSTKTITRRTPSEHPQNQQQSPTAVDELIKYLIYSRYSSFDYDVLFTRS